MPISCAKCGRSRVTEGDERSELALDGPHCAAIAGPLLVSNPGSFLASAEGSQAGWPDETRTLALKIVTQPKSFEHFGPESKLEQPEQMKRPTESSTADRVEVGPGAAWILLTEYSV